MGKNELFYPKEKVERGEKMKKLLLTLLVIMLAVMLLNAHPASDVKVSFDKNTSILKVDFTHKVDNEASHFVYDVEVKLNSKKAIKQELLKQETKEGGSVLYKLIDAKAGDKIQVITDCNKGGKKSETLVVK